MLSDLLDFNPSTIINTCNLNSTHHTFNTSPISSLSHAVLLFCMFLYFLLRFFPSLDLYCHRRSYSPESFGYCTVYIIFPPRSFLRNFSSYLFYPQDFKLDNAVYNTFYIHFSKWYSFWEAQWAWFEFFGLTSVYTCVVPVSIRWFIGWNYHKSRGGRHPPLLSAQNHGGLGTYDNSNL